MTNATHVLLAVISIIVLGCQTAPDPKRADEANRQMQLQVVQSIAQSHIDANVPRAEDFDKFLRRDLKAFLAAKGHTGTLLNVEMLRKGPTQTGIAWPKFYVWITLTREGKVVVEGATRLAAIDKKKFEVTDFVTRKQAADEDLLLGIFPSLVVDEIKKKL